MRSERMEEQLIDLIRKEEQLRILKNYIKTVGVTKLDVEKLVEAIEQKEETYE